MICHAVFLEIIGSDLFRAVSASDHRFAFAG
jgi:hypothetical protein